MIDIFNPQISEVTKGVEGKIIMIYGTNRTGKTLNATRAKKPFVVGFERGLNAIAGIPFAPITKWNDWTNTVKQLTGTKMEEAKKLYNTIIIDTMDAMGELASDYVCGVYGADSIGSGNNGFGIWKEYESEINKWIRTLSNSGYTIIFIGHENEREFQDDKGEKFTKIYPHGDKRVVKPILDISDFICYAQVQNNNDKGEFVNSTLYLSGTRAFHAGSRFRGLIASIPEWTMEKLEKAIGEAVELEEQASGQKAVDFKDAQQKIADQARSPYEDKTLQQLVELCVTKGQETITKTGSPAFYQEVLFEQFGTRDFQASKATEQQRPQLEQLIEALIDKGY